jgi:hypothetical protein
MQTLTEIGATQNSTVIFPLPLDVLKPFLDAAAPPPSGEAQAKLPGNGRGRLPIAG